MVCDVGNHSWGTITTKSTENGHSISQYPESGYSYYVYLSVSTLRC